MNLYPVSRRRVWTVRARFLAAAAIVVNGLYTNAAAQITVGKNVQISKQRAGEPHYEYLAGAHATDPRKMIACGEAFPLAAAAKGDTTNPFSSVVYVTQDGGQTWKETLRIVGAQDPECKFALGDTAYFVGLSEKMEIYRSVDGGMTWDKPVKLPFIDREYVAVDRSGGKYHGRVYINGTGGVRGMENEYSPNSHTSAVTLYRSGDGGRSFMGPANRAAMPGRHVLGMGNSEVLSDGTVVTIFGLLKHSDGSQTETNSPNHANAWLKLARSTDGGEQYAEVVNIDDFYMAWPPDWTAVIPMLAVDHRAGAFKDRIYAVWPDERSGRSEILFSYSMDKGKTWTRARVLNDDRAPLDPKSTQSHMLPTVAVNKDGVIGVSWYDRRDRSDMGWTIRFSASLDGGETWMPSVLVSSSANTYDGHESWAVDRIAKVTGSKQDSTFSFTARVPGWFWYASGHTSGMMADASGAFHPVWGDNRTGVSQMWTAPVTVNGTAIRNGAAELAEYYDLSGRVTLLLYDMSMDRGRSTITVNAELKNTSKDTIKGPIKVRVTRVGSALGIASLDGSDNGQTGAGAIFDFSSLLKDGQLKPDESSKSKKLTIRIRDLRPIKQGNELQFGLVDLQARVLGKGILPVPKPPVPDTSKKSDSDNH